MNILKEEIMRVIIGCEFSQIITMAFRNRGHEAYSCDLLPTEGQHPEWHYQEDIFEVLKREHFDIGIFHPPCTYLAASGARWFKGNIDRHLKRLDAIKFVETLWNTNIKKIAIENPIGFLSTMSELYEPTQIIQPYEYGHPEKKSTCLWLKNLPELQPTKIMNIKEQRIHKLSALNGKGSSKNRQKERSRTYRGIADAMATQWGKDTTLEELWLSTPDEPGYNCETLM